MDDLLAHIGELNDSPQVSGILVQMPLPPQLGAELLQPLVAEQPRSENQEQESDTVVQRRSSASSQL